MTNRDAIMAASDEELAEMLIQVEYRTDYRDEFEYPVFITTDGLEYWDYDSALENEITWLRKKIN